MKLVMSAPSSSCLMVIMIVLSAVVNLTLAAAPAAIDRRQHINHDIPNLDMHALSVAKSPFEPVTLAPNNANARNDGMSSSSSSTTEQPSSQPDPPKSGRLTTRDAEPEEDSTATTNSDEAVTTAAPAPATTTTTPPPQASSEATTTSKPEVSTATDATEPPTTTGADFEIDSSTVAATTTTTTTTTTPKPPAEDAAIDLQRLPVSTTTTTTPAPPATDPSTEPAEQTTGAPPAAEDTTSPPPADSATSSIAPSTERPSTTETSPPEPEPETTTPSQPESENVQPAITTTTTTTTEAPQPAVEAATTSAPEVPSSSTTQTPAEEPSSPATTTPAPAPAPEVTSSPQTEAPSSSTTPTPTTTTTTPTTTTTTTTQAPVITEPVVAANVEKNDESNKRTTEQDNGSDRASCNHLPTYESDELQKVFREETTYKNGTIKGKFTYINFDQRYRLVHYTRLPYGPVKIDLVEELGRPADNGSNQNQAAAAAASPPNPNDIPNAVLQLRNILPNSLFGFPFVGPSQGPRSGALEHTEQRAENIPSGNDNDKSNTYFYSTDSISTPNLLSSTVPVALFPGQRRASQPFNSHQPDTLSQSLNENLQVGPRTMQSPPSQLKQKQQEILTPPGNQNIPYSVPASPEHQQPQQQLKHHSTLVYTYLSHAPPQPASLTQYQYSPMPLYTFNQPPYYSTSSSFSKQSLQQDYNFKLKHNQESLEHQKVGAGDIVAPPTSHHHQPHGHEHYVAPFMFSQPSPALQQNEPAEGPRLKLKVKTSKSLSINHDQGGQQQKSAQLRAQPVAYSQSPFPAPANIKSPVQVHRSELLQQQPNQHHRSGKQNQELKQTINTSPVVYHVLRSPLGRMYSLPQYQQAHAMAYDHDQ